MSRPVRGSATYRAVLSLPRARTPFAAALLARLCYGVLPLPLLLSLRDATGSYTAAGTAVGLFGLICALLGPLRARLVERRPVALPVLAGAHAVLLAVVAACAAASLPAWASLAPAVLAGLFPPPVGPLMRTLWGELAADEEQHQRALSLDTVAESTVFALGPVLAGLLVSAWSAPVALAVCAALFVVAFAVFAHALRGRPAAARPSSAGVVTGPLRAPGVVPLLLVVLAVAAAAALADIAIVAAWGAGTAGPLLALFSVGGAVGGLAYGRRTWRSGPGPRLLVLAAAAAGCYTLPVLVPSPAGAAVGLLLAGACTDALLVTGYLLVDVLVPAGSRTEAGAWVNTAWNLGGAFGSSAAGLLMDRAGAAAGFTAAGAVLGAAAVLGAVWRSPLRGRSLPAPQVPVEPDEQARGVRAGDGRTFGDGDGDWNGNTSGEGVVGPLLLAGRAGAEDAVL
ncbi:MFS transporter [Kitasatospora sp. NE20-6]|uniref:MFS transporter n=1 Tax=Kitasatospora sp. NE20-6 TaxID=2859066 RepID=UPI0034DC3173